MLEALPHNNFNLEELMPCKKCGPSKSKTGGTKKKATKKK